MGIFMMAAAAVMGVLVICGATGGLFGWLIGSNTELSRSNENLIRSMREHTDLSKLILHQSNPPRASTPSAITGSTTTDISTINSLEPRLESNNSMNGGKTIYYNPGRAVVRKTKRFISREQKTRMRRAAYVSPWGEPETPTKGPLIALTDDASVNNTATSSTKYKINIMESGLIAPNLGLVMDQVGTYMEYSGYIYVPIIYHMPHLADANLQGNGTTCNITANKPHQQLIVDLLKDKIGTLIPENHQARHKRFLATMILGGAVAWNRASIWSLQDTVSMLDKQLQTIREQQHIVVDSINTLVGNQQAIHHAVNRQARILREFLDRSDCNALITNYFREVYSTWLSMAPNDFSRVVDSALSGKITPDLLPATDVISTLLRHPSLVDTAYSQDMTLLYELGKLSLHQVNYDPYPMVSGVMIFPRIILDRSASLMRIHTTYAKNGLEYRKLKVPDVVACKKESICWEISSSSCKEMLTLTLCPKQTKPKYNLCINKMLSSKVPTSSCEWSLTTRPELEVIQFDGGVLVSANNVTGEIMIHQAKELIVHKVLDPSDHPLVLTSLDGDYLHIGGQIYQLTQETLRTGYEIKLNFTIPHQHETLEGLDTEGWTDESRIPQLRDEPWAPPRHLTWWVVVGLIASILMFFFVLIRYRYKFKHIKEKIQTELAGWMTVPSAPPSYNIPQTGHRRAIDIIV